MNPLALRAKPSSTAIPPPWHSLDADEVLRQLAVDPRHGLSFEEARRRLAAHGPNSLGEPARRSVLSIFIDQFKSPLIYLLFVAAGVALALGHVSDATVIFVVVILNATIGSLQEGRAEHSLTALRKLAVKRARVIRTGRHAMVEAQEIVPGDLLILEAGDAVCADVRLLEAAALRLDESTLTGESNPAPKSPKTLSADTPLADRVNMAFAGTYVAAGRARGVVVTTGLGSEVGRIASLAESAQEPRTPLERRISQFGRTLALAALGMFALVAGVGVFRGIGFGEILMVAISQTVGMIPEGLPAAMTIALSVGVQRMARRKAVVRHLYAVETLGSTTVICSDKTGTLTRNEMTVREIWLPGGRRVRVTGSGYEPVGQLLMEDISSTADANVPLRELLTAGILCNDAQLEQLPDGSWRGLGDPTEVALLTLALKAGLDPAAVRRAQPRWEEVPFDSLAQVMATRHRAGRGSTIQLKGAPEVVLGLCRPMRREADVPQLSLHLLEEIEAEAERMARNSLRVLALAVVPEAGSSTPLTLSGIQGRGTLLGLIGQLDPPREEVKSAIRRCQAAGIRTVMVTGDHKATGEAIARELGILRAGEVTLDGRELEELTDEQLSERIERVAVFARVQPAQKLRIVDALQRRDEVVAMTGDGVNDAPALVKANVGVAMGRSGTDVAKEAADIVIADDNFISIAAAIEEGRVVYRNIKKVVLYLFSTAAAEVLTLMGALALGYPPPLAAVQILWINLVTESTVTVNLIMEPAEGDEMQQMPTSPQEPLLTSALLSRVVVMTMAMTLSALGWFVFRIESREVPFPQAQTEVFTLLAVCQWFNALNCRSGHASALTQSPFRNPWLIFGLVLGSLSQVLVVYWRPLGDVFHTVPLSGTGVLLIGALASLVFWVEEARKFFVRRHRKQSRVA